MTVCPPKNYPPLHEWRRQKFPKITQNIYNSCTLILAIRLYYLLARPKVRAGTQHRIRPRSTSPLGNCSWWWLYFCEEIVIAFKKVQQLEFSSLGTNLPQISTWGQTWPQVPCIRRSRLQSWAPQTGKSDKERVLNNMVLVTIYTQMIITIILTLQPG